MEKNKLTLLAILVLLSASNVLFVLYANDQEKTRNKDAENFLSKTNVMEEEKQYVEKECEVLKMYLDDKHYVYPNRDEFKKKCAEYWGINVDTVPYVYNHGEDQLFIDCMIFRKGSESVYYYPFYDSQINGEPKGDAKEALAAMKYADDSLDYYYNQLLFHDDKRVIPKFMNMPEHAFNVVYYHNYEKNKLLLQKAATQYTWPTDRFWKDLRNALFYNNLSRGVRKDFIRLITHFKEENPKNYTLARQEPEFCGFMDMFIDVYDYIDVPVELKDECLCYMILLLYDFCEDFNAKYSCGEAYGAYEVVNKMVNQNGYDFIERIEKKSYYGNQKLKEIIRSGVQFPFYDRDYEGIVDRGLAILLGRVIDKDGYVNLRAAADLKSNVIGTIPTGEDVRFVDMTEDEIYAAKMLKVRTKDGRIGYVHKSRLQLYMMDTDEHRKSVLRRYHLPYVKEYEW